MAGLRQQLLSVSADPGLSSFLLHSGGQSWPDVALLVNMSSHVFWSLWFLMRNTLLIVWRSPCMC